MVIFLSFIFTEKYNNGDDVIFKYFKFCTGLQYCRVKSGSAAACEPDGCWRRSWAPTPRRVVFWEGESAWWSGWGRSRWDAEERANTGSR